jgi:hypothetical protein
MTTDLFIIVYCFILTIAVSFLLAKHYADRVERAAVYSSMGMSVSRCITAEKNCTRFESKSAEYASAARHAANDAKVHRDHVQGLHDCMKPRPDDTVDFTPSIDPEGRTGEMGGQS